MSNKQNDPTVVSVAPEPQEKTEEPKQSRVRKAVDFVKTHKKPAIAMVGLGALVAVSALAGRKTAPGPDVFFLELESPETDDVEIVEQDDTTVA